MNKKIFVICIIVAFSVWVTPFLLVLSLDPGIHNVHKKESHIQKNNNQVVEKIVAAYAAENRAKVFRLIFLNNLKVAIINVVGGVFLGLGTFVNLLQNGIYTAHIFATLHYDGNSWGNIITNTAPHSFEMLGIWLSGGLGFFIATMLYNAIRKNKYPISREYKTISVLFILAVLIILLAAYIEAFVSI